jgi:hypothetical protein
VRYLGLPASGVVTTAYRTVTEFTATASQTTFSVPSYTVGYVDVYRNGVMLGSADYTATSGTTIVLASGATAGDLVEVISFYVSSVLNAIPGTAGSVGTTYLADGSVTAAKLASGVGAFGGQVFTSNGTFTIPTGVTALKVTVVGGGGSSAGQTGSACCPTFVAGNSGGTSSVASGTQTISTISATGGAGGASSGYRAGGLGSGGDINGRGGFGGNSGSGPATSIFSSSNTSGASTLGAGGLANSTNFFIGAAGGSAIKFLTGLTPGNTLSVTIGSGGAQVGSVVIGYAGGAGVVLFEW